MAGRFVLFTLAFTLLLGSYNYIQNYVYYRNPAGTGDTAIISGYQGFTDFSKKLAYNSTRLGVQFISCEGLPLPFENTCLQVKKSVLGKIFATATFNIEANKYMLEPGCRSLCYSLSNDYPLNEESAWYGILSWILIIPGCIMAIVKSIQEKKKIPLLIILTSLIYFLIIAVFKSGWDPYQGRYLILSVALVTPFSGFLLTDQKPWQRASTTLFSVLSIFILVYTILANDSKPLVNRQSIWQIELWGKDHSSVVQKVAYKIEPWFKEDRTVFDYSFSELQTYFANNMASPVELVNQTVPINGKMGIVAEKGIFMDYLFFGENFTRGVYDLPNYSDTKYLNRSIQANGIKYLLVSPGLQFKAPKGFNLVNSLNGWSIYGLN
ncbi:MAG: hypothetical protein GYA35_00880 [Thermoanaerobaculaceae bacterium]|nr:hypothetical protein [Thermoanaerobaculaceae bacterium]